jgi:ATP-dependent DNA helicase 2 subunit 2
LVIAADVGRRELSKHALHVSRSILLHKVLYGGKSDALGLVIFGTTTTRNDVHSEMVAVGDDSQYLNIYTLQYLSVITPALLEYFSAKDQELAGGKSDFLDALMVSSDMLSKDPLKSKKRLKVVLVSNFLDPISDLDDEFRDQCLSGLRMNNVQVELVSLSPLSSIPKENRDLIEHMGSTGVSSFEFVHDYEGYAAFREIKLVQPTCTKQVLAIGQDLQIPVSVYKKISKAGISKNFKIKQFHKDDNNNIYEAKRETEYKKVDGDDDTIIEDKTRAFPYGKDLIPIDETTAALLSPEAEERSLLLLGFKERDCFPQHSFLDEAWIVLPDPSNIGAQEALSALVRTLDENDQVAVVRCVSRYKAEAFLSIWIPYKSAREDTIPDSFIMCMLPFAEDLREYSFASLNACDKWIPSEEELSLAENIIDSMSLVDKGNNNNNGVAERVIPEKIANPTIHNMHQYLAKRLHPGAGDAKNNTNNQSLRVLSGPSEDLLMRAKPHITRMAELVKSNIKKEE